MEKYIWLNPVAQAMYGGADLDKQLKERGFLQVQHQGDHIATVKEKYRQAVRATSGCVADVRCPLAVQYIRDKYHGNDLDFPDIEPILLHCARELQQTLKDKGTLLVTTPCKSLSEQGAALHLPNTTFLPFLQFAQSEGIRLTQQALQDSPIPPGFFAEYGDSAKVLDSKEKIDRYFSHPETRGSERILELLYCPRGCHHGDGIQGG